MIISCLQVMQSAAGYYLGHAYLEDEMVGVEKDGEKFVGMPYSRESVYFHSINVALKYLELIERLGRVDRRGLNETLYD